MLAWFSTQIRPQAPGLWLVLSLICFLILLLLWGTLTERRRRMVVLIRWLLIPYLGLISGGLSLRLLGLSAIDWPATFSLGAGMLFFLLAAVTLVRAITLSSSPRMDRTHLAHNRAPTPASNTTPQLTICLLSGAEELHWAFLRGGIWELMLHLPTPPANTPYLAIWLATAWGATELALTPMSGRRRLLKLVILLTSAILFLFTRNFWLCWLFHTAAWLILWPVDHEETMRQETPWPALLLQQPLKEKAGDDNQ
jgi:hypothetical protein